MREVAPGVRWFTAVHEHIKLEVSSYWLPEERVLIDPMVPDEGLDAFSDSPPEHILLSNRHHDRHAWDYVDRFGSTVHCVRNGMHEIEGKGQAEPFDFGDELPGGVVAHEVGAICPDDCALHIPAHSALVCADGVVKWPGQDDLAFVPDNLMDEPEKTKEGLRTAYSRLADELDFDALLLAHGSPVEHGGREALRAFVSG